MSGDGDRIELLSERACPWTDHMRLPRMPVECLQQRNQISFRPTNRFNPMHIQNSSGHYLASG